MIYRLFAFALSLVVLVGCSSPGGFKERTVSEQAGDVVKITILQINDLYELTPNGSEQGGVARVTTLLKRLKAENPNTIGVMAGDLFSPSALGTAVVGGKRIAGEQMVAILNASRWDYMTFGNHEFDLTQAEFDARMSEIKFRMFTSNVLNTNGQPIANTHPAQILTFTNAQGRTAKLGLIGITMDALSSSYVKILPPVETAQAEVARFRPQVDALVLVTHLPLEQDVEITEKTPGIDLIIGGHEHENIQLARGPGLTTICKADSNARTAYIHRMEVRGHRVTVKSELFRITADLPEDTEVARTVSLWREKAFSAFREKGFNPENRVTVTTEALDGRESVVRSGPSRLTQIIADGMRHSFSNADAAIFNGGSIRIDDIIPAGPVTEYDVLRVMPFGGDVVLVELPGSVLKEVLIQGKANKGSGGFLYSANITNADGAWQVGGESIVDDRAYKVSFNSFLLTGRERRLEFLNPEKNPNLKKLPATPIDIRKSLIAELNRIYHR